MTGKILHKKGSKIYCIENNHLIGELKQDISSGGRASCDDISWQEGKELFSGEMPCCRECGSFFAHVMGRGFIKYNTKEKNDG